MSPWDVLGLPPGAPPDEIKKAYKALARKHHPDKGGDPEEFKRISKAYEEALNPPPPMPGMFHQQPQQIRRRWGEADTPVRAVWSAHKGSGLRLLARSAPA